MKFGFYASLIASLILLFTLDALSQETYPATDGETYLVPLPDTDRPQQSPQASKKETPAAPKPKKKPMLVERSKAPAKKLPELAKATNGKTSPDCRVASLVQQRGKFDKVPDAHVEALTERLKVVQELMSRHQRAYDYRIHTSDELRSILNSLDESAEKAAAENLPPDFDTDSEAETTADSE